MDAYKASMDYIVSYLSGIGIQSNPLLVEIDDIGDGVIGVAVDTKRVTSEMIDNLMITFNDNAESFVRFLGGSIVQSGDMTTPLFMLKFVTSKECSW